MHFDIIMDVVVVGGGVVVVFVVVVHVAMDLNSDMKVKNLEKP